MLLVTYGLFQRCTLPVSCCIFAALASIPCVEPCLLAFHASKHGLIASGYDDFLFIFSIKSCKVARCSCDHRARSARAAQPCKIAPDTRRKSLCCLHSRADHPRLAIGDRVLLLALSGRPF